MQIAEELGAEHYAVTQARAGGEVVAEDLL
jgi:hypothetical protein